MRLHTNATTIKQQTLFNRDANINGLQKTVATQYNDKAKITIKQQTIYQRDGYLKGKTVGYFVNYKDVPATTLKQLLGKKETKYAKENTSRNSSKQ